MILDSFLINLYCKNIFHTVIWRVNVEKPRILLPLGVIYWLLTDRLEKDFETGYCICVNKEQRKWITWIENRKNVWALRILYNDEGVSQIQSDSENSHWVNETRSLGVVLKYVSQRGLRYRVNMKVWCKSKHFMIYSEYVFPVVSIKAVIPLSFRLSHMQPFDPLIAIKKKVIYFYK